MTAFPLLNPLRSVPLAVLDVETTGASADFGHRVIEIGIARYEDGQKVAEGHVPKTQPYAFSGDEGADVGMDLETAVSNDYKQGDNKFTGRIVKVTIDVKPSRLAPADQKAVGDAGEAAAVIED